MILLEHTAGQGTSLGATFEQLASIIAKMNDHRRVGVCLDTCHLLASGYDLCSPEGYASTFTQFGRLVGFDRLKAFHLNDSKKPLGSRVDRHEHIGQGFLGLEPFRRIVNDRRFRDLPMLLETPKAEGRGPGPLPWIRSTRRIDHAAEVDRASLEQALTDLPTWMRRIASASSGAIDSTSCCGRRFSARDRHRVGRDDLVDVGLRAEPLDRLAGEQAVRARDGDALDPALAQLAPALR